MERLEAALAKARADRQKVLSEGATHGSAVSRPSVSLAASQTDWSVLPPLEISRRTISRSRLIALDGGKESVPYDMLRARVLQQMKTTGGKRLAITSADTGCGKTTVSLNLAFSLARQADLRILLMDFDLRNPSIAKALHQNTQADMAQLLQGEVSFENFAVRHGHNLAICMNRQPVPQSAELLHAQKTAEQLNQIITTCSPDLVIFDLPPLQGNDDTLGFLEQVDGVLLVAAADKTTISQVDVSERELSELSNVIGVVLNKCRYHDAESGYGGKNYY